jgi:hypothetical protein
MLCPKCDSSIREGEKRCVKCGASLAALTNRINRPGSIPEIEKMRIEREINDKIGDKKLKQRWIKHGIAGAILFFVVHGVLNIAALLDAGRIFWGILWAVLLGFPMGYVISRMNADRYKGMFIGAITSGIILGAIGLIYIGEITAAGFISGASTGAIPGFLIGLHCELDR